MSLLSAFTEDFIRMKESGIPDGSGGRKSEWTDGEAIRAAAVRDTPMEARIAGATGTVSVYTITTPREAHLKFHDCIKRVRDGKVFRMTSDNGEKQTPAITALDMAQCSAEEWRLPE